MTGNGGWADEGPDDLDPLTSHPVNPPPPVPRNPAPAPASPPPTAPMAPVRATVPPPATASQVAQPVPPPASKTPGQGVTIPPKALWGAAAAVAVLLVGGVAFALGNSNGNGDTTAASTNTSTSTESLDDQGQDSLDSAPSDKSTIATPDDTAASPTPDADPVVAELNECWDGSRIDRGTRCSTDFDADALFWAFGIDGGQCVQQKSYDWSDLGYKCVLDGSDIRIALWKSPSWRDRRLSEYGSGSDVGKGMVQHSVGSAGRYALRYASDDVLLYATVDDEESYVLDAAFSSARSLDEVLTGTEISN